MDSDSPVAVVSDSPVVELQDSVPPESVVVPKDDSSLLASEMVLQVLQFLLDSESLDYVPDSVAPDRLRRRARLFAGLRRARLRRARLFAAGRVCMR